MCRTKEDGGRRCPGCTGPAAAEAHNRRRRENRRARNEAVALARSTGLSSEIIEQLRSASPAAAKRLASEAGLLGPTSSELSSSELPPTADDHRCPGCGQFTQDSHQCPALPAGNYASVKGDERTRQMLDDLEAAVAAVVSSGQMQRWLDAMASNGLGRWSMNNRILAMLQMIQRGKDIEGLHLMGFRQWDQYNRRVRKGAKAVWILAPVVRKVTEEDDAGTVTETKRVVGFRNTPVFDVSDTEGDPMPAPPVRPAVGEATPGTLTGLRDRVAQAGYTYSEEEIPGCNPQTGEGRQGFTDPQSKRIVVDSRLSPAHKASVIAHELGHVHCGHVDGDYAEYQAHRGQMETEAEMTAYMVGRARGMSQDQVDAFSPGYIATWSGGDSHVIKSAMDKATKAYNRILDGDWPQN
jgi:hypothetical protein